MEKSFRRSLGQLSEVFSFADTFIVAEQIDPDYVGTIHLVLEEIFTNLVKYNQGTRSKITIHLSVRQDQLAAPESCPGSGNQSSPGKKSFGQPARSWLPWPAGSKFVP